MSRTFNLAVYCSASDSLPAEWVESGRRLGHWIAETDSTLIYGGVDAGLMRIIAGAVKSSHGGRAVGVVPSLRASQASPDNDTVIPSRGLHDRKETMLSLADAFVALPGGYGTLDEILTTFAHLRFNNINHKKLIILNIDNVFGPLIDQLHSMTANGLMKADALSLLTVVSSADELISALNKIRNEEI